MLSYINHQESRTLVGVKTAGKMSDSGVNVSSSGEFGESLTGIFRPESKARFTWKETDTLRGEPAEVFDYRIEQQNSDFSWKFPNQWAWWATTARFISIGLRTGSRA